MNELIRNIDQSRFKARSGAVGGVYSEWLKLEISSRKMDASNQSVHLRFTVIDRQLFLE
ncbi:hypothetical protein [Paenibacillus polymyxa]|uniref:hypothetical protein n=1 Tax=Paenibacillus polymyxa TaxID=1406 RepID=UPI0004B6BAD9|nr:hypothetical protein [Paenibacillus polymyxa]